MRNLYDLLFLVLTLFTQFLFHKKIEKRIIIIPLPLLLVPEWPYLPLNPKGLAFYIKRKLYFDFQTLDLFILFLLAALFLWIWLSV